MKVVHSRFAPATIEAYLVFWFAKQSIFAMSALLQNSEDAIY